MDPNHFLMWILLRFELFDYFNGSCSSKDQVFAFTTIHLEEMSHCPQKAFSDENELNLQDELLQWNRLTEEMLYLIIVIVGTVRSSRLRVWSRRERRMMNDPCFASR